MKKLNHELECETSETGLLTKRQVAANFAVCERTITRWTARGLLKSIRVNARVIRYTRESVSQLLTDATV